MRLLNIFHAFLAFILIPASWQFVLMWPQVFVELNRKRKVMILSLIV